MNIKGFITPTASVAHPWNELTLSDILGVRINTKLTWKHHVSAKAKAYIVLVCLHHVTCSPVWTPYQRGALDDLEKVQKCAARWICAKWSNYCWSKTYEECHSNINWATVHQRHLLLTCCKACKIVNNIDCLWFEDYFCAILCQVS